jgi:biopolymer transport protein ExbB
MNILQSFHEGGVFMYFILIFGVFTLAFIIERAMALYMKLKNPPSDFRVRLSEFLGRGDLKGAESYAMSRGADTPRGRIAEIGCQLRGSAAGDEEVQARMDEALSAEMSAIEKRTGFLAMFGNVSTLLGLLGTISGMIHSFAAVANASPVD